jgi:hypothetical protein
MERGTIGQAAVTKGEGTKGHGAYEKDMVITKGEGITGDGDYEKRRDNRTW